MEKVYFVRILCCNYCKCTFDSAAVAVGKPESLFGLGPKAQHSRFTNNFTCGQVNIYNCAKLKASVLTLSDLHSSCEHLQGVLLLIYNLICLSNEQ